MVVRGCAWLSSVGIKWPSAAIRGHQRRTVRHCTCCKKGVMSVADRGSYTRGEAELEDIQSVRVEGQ